MTAVATLLSILDDTLTRLASPRAWLQGHYQGHRDRGGALIATHILGPRPANCFCLTRAITLAVDGLEGETHRAQVRADVEREILESIEVATGRRWTALYRFNDSESTSYADVIGALKATRERLADHANECEAVRLAELDARHGTEPRALTGHLAPHQFDYDLAMSAELARIAIERESN